MATIPANNNTGLYNTSGVPATTGNDLTVTGNVNANNINAVNTVNAGTTINAGTDVNASGNITASGYFIGDGSQLTNISANAIVGSYSNANVAAYLSSGTVSSNVITTANVSGGNIVTSGVVSAGGNVRGANLNTAGVVSADGNITALGNISGSYILGNGSQLTGIPPGYTDANVNTHLAAFGSNTISTTGNITAGYFIGDGSQLTGLPAQYGNANVAAFLPTYTGNLAGGNIHITQNALVDNDLTVGGTIYGTFSGNIAGNLVVPGANTEVIYNNNGNAGASSDFTFNNATKVLYVNGNVDVGGSLNTDDVTSNGNVTINGNQIITGNLTVQGTTTTINSNTITTNDKTITVANNQSTGANVDGAGLEAGNPAVATWLYNNASNTWKSSIGVSAVGNITGAYIFGNGSQLTGLPASYGNANVAAYLPTYSGNIGNTASDLKLTGNSIGLYGANTAFTGFPTLAITSPTPTDSYVTTPGATRVTLPGANFAGDLVSVEFTYDTTINGRGLAVTGNLFGTGNSITTTGNIATLGIKTDGYYYANGTPISFGGTYGDANVNAHLAALGSNVISSTGNITTTANISGAYILGNGSQLTGLPASYGNANVSDYLASGTNTANIITTGNIQGGNLIATSVVTPGSTGNLFNIAATTVNIGGAATTVKIAAPNSLAVIGNTNTYTSQGNVTSMFVGNNLALYSGYSNLLDRSMLLNNLYYDSTGTSRYRNTTSNGAATLNFTGGQGFLFGGISGNVTANATSGVGLWATISSASLSTAGSIPINSGGGMTVGSGVLATGAANSFMYNTITTNIGIGGAANTIQIGSPTVALTVGSGTGNVTAGNVIVNSRVIATGNVSGGNVVATSNIDGGNINVTGTVIAGGNVSGNYILGNGFYLTGISGSSYSNAQVAAYLASGTNTSNIITTGNVSGGNLLGTNGLFVTNGNATLSKELFVAGNIWANASKIQGGNVTVGASGGGSTLLLDGANIDYQNGAATIRVGGNVTTVGGSFVGVGANISGNASVGGILTNNYYYANGSPIPFGYGDSNVTTLLASFGSNTITTTGNITGANLVAKTALGANGNIYGLLQGGQPYITQVGQLNGLSVINGATVTGNIDLTGNINVTGWVSADNADIGGNLNVSGPIAAPGSDISGGSLTVTGNVQGAYIKGNGSLLTGISGTYSNANVASFLSSSFGSNTITTTGNITAGYFSTGTGAGNISGANYIYGNILVGNTSITTTGKVTAGAVTYANTDGTSGQVLTTYGNGVTYFSTVSGGGGTPGGSTTQLQYNNGGAFAGNAAMTFDNTTGNIGLGNLIVNTQQIQTTQAANVGLTTSLVPNPGRIFVGTGYNGNSNPAYDLTNYGRSARLAISDSYGITDGNSVVRGLAIQNYYTLNANTSSANTRIGGLTSGIIVGGGASANTIGGSIFALAGTVNTITIGGGTSGNLTALGNTTAQYGAGMIGAITLNAGSTGGNLFGQITNASLSGTASNTYLAYTTNYSGSTTPGNVFFYHVPSNTSTYGPSISNTARNATNYYAFRNDDDVAQTKLGSLRLFHEYEYALSSSAGALTVDKNNGQVQFLTVSEAITSVTFSNFVTSASTNSTTKYQTDTVTVIVQQDATGRAITMPSGATYKYAGGSNTIPTTANSVSMVSITAVYNTVAAATQYLITISPEFS